MAIHPHRNCPKCGRELAAEAQFCPIDGFALPPTPSAFIGLVLDRRYRLIESIGRGGMGTVYRAVHLDLNRAVAVKVLNGDLVNDSVAVARFRREAKALGKIAHPNAVAVSDFGVTPEGLAYIVMELLEGRNLRVVIARESPLSVERVARIIRQVSSAVSAAHACGVIHRDLKPDNVVLVGSGPSETAKVLDFGIAKLRSTGGLTGQLTARDAVVGTPQYMSPEACQASELTPATDIYALGVIAYELLAGVVPFDGPSSLEVALKHVHDAPPRLLARRPDVPSDVESVIFRAMSKDLRFRQQSADEFGAQMEAAARASEQALSRATSRLMGPSPWEPPAPVARPVDDSALLGPLAIAGLAAFGAVLGLILALAAIYVLAPPPTSRPPGAIEGSDGSVPATAGQ